ncbi:hypothetical protein DFP72DRAFT_899927 [Ephemerocybe angulata]|uniref:RRM domain-containing protein n=1 Tax=Ephemerocybe angulata TaxID=980116 RepID=A0A8H6HW41_9AGAR|nr:hypothetical protein DFP72DRAFT_899927 [Tulosesus angulatus]
MNRHHPYNASFDGPPRRGGSPAGHAGPDRSHRHQDRGGGAGFRGRGGFNNRGRGGGYSSYDGANMSNAYDQSSQSQPYTDYEVQPPGPSAYFQSNTYGDGSHYNNGAPGYEAYDKYEDGPPPQGYDTDFNRRPPRPQRKDRDDKVHDSIIEERIQRERPCRTLFIRNIKYETNSDDVRALFEEHGEIKTFFDLISTRGMVFVTYFDLRAAERARDRLQGSEISGRPIDVHYSLPRDDQRGGEREKNQQFQGTLQVTLRNSPSGQGIDDSEIRRKFQQFGDVKSVRSVNERIDSRYVEFYDIRACEEAYDRLRHQGLQDGVMDIVFAWDNTDSGGFGGPGHNNGRENGAGGHHRNWEEQRDRGHRGGRGRGRGRGRGGRNGADEGHDRPRDDYGGANRRFDDEYGRGGGRTGGGGGGGYNDRYNDARGGYSAPPSNYGPPPVPAPLPYTIAPGGPSSSSRKVQQLLAALKQPQGGPSGSSTPTTSMAPPLGGALPPGPPMPPSGNPYYAQAPPSMPPYPGSMPPATTYTGVSSSAAPTPPPSSGASLPPNIMALIQQATQRQPTGPPAGYGMPPGQPPAGGAAPAQYLNQQLMSYLSQSQPQGPK